VVQAPKRGIRRSPHPFGSFKGLGELSELTVDFDFMTPAMYEVYYERVLHVSEPHKYLPSSLESLHVTCIPARNVNALLANYSKTAPLDLIQGRVVALGLRKISLSITMEDRNNNEESGTTELLKRLRKFNPEVVNELFNMGTTLRVWRQGGRFDAKLLYEPGFAASWPHWSDMAQEHWTEADRLIWEVKQGLREPSLS
jgi:hypothetical protein